MEVVRDIDLLIRKILDAFSKHDKNTAFTIAMSGIDGAGKGFVAKRLVEALEDKGLKVANVNIDPWQNPIAVRLQKENAAENVYQNIFRWEQFFGELIVPLQ